MRIYLDNCCYNRPYDDQTSIKISLETQAKLSIQEMVKLGKYALVSSETLEYEVDASPYSSQVQIIKGFIQENTSFYVGKRKRDDVEKLAIEITQTGVKYYDACHVASAIIADCEYFVTVDKRLLNYQSDKVRIVSPIQFISETEGI